MLLTKLFRLVACAAVCVTAVGQSPQADALAYQFTDLGAGSFASGINNSGQVAGNLTVGGVNHATVWNGGTPTDLGSGDARGINNVGQVVGNSNGQAVVWSSGSTTQLGSFSANSINDHGQIAGDLGNHIVVWNNGATSEFGGGNIASFARAINNSGQVAGASIPSFVYPWIQTTVWDTNSGTATILGRLGSYENLGHDINDSGVIVGHSYAGPPENPFDDRHAAYWSGGSIFDLGDGEANGINNFGQIVGAGASGAVLWQGGAMYDLNSFLDASTVAKGWVLRDAKDINDGGWIVGTAFNTITGESRAFVLTPMPEPEIYATLAIGLGVVGFVARRRRKAA